MGVGLPDGMSGARRHPRPRSSVCAKGVALRAQDVIYTVFQFAPGKQLQKIRLLPAHMLSDLLMCSHKSVTVSF